MGDSCGFISRCYTLAHLQYSKLRTGGILVNSSSSLTPASPFHKEVNSLSNLLVVVSLGKSAH